MTLFPRARRRRPGIYLYRTRRHSGWGTEWGYGGKSNHLPLRAAQHAATSSWFDLVVWRGQWRLPWWLGWQWVTLSLETIMILVVRPRYNVQKNPRRNKVNKALQASQRIARDAARASGVRRERSLFSVDLVVRAAAVLMILTGLSGYFLNR